VTDVTSNRLSDLAERVRIAEAAMTAASQEMAGRALEAGRLLMEAKEESRHGEWLPFLGHAGMHERQARRLMQLARSGLKPDTVSDLGIKRTLAILAKWKLPRDGNVLTVSTKHASPEGFGGTVFVWECHDEPGYYHAAGIARDFAFSDATRRPISGVFPEVIFRSVAKILEDRHDEMDFASLVIPREICETFRLAVHDTEDAEGFAVRALVLIRVANKMLAA
jgi:Protein of unknown function (DUF3102)